MSIESNEDGIFKAGKRIGYYDDDGNLRMTRGNAGLRAEVEAWAATPKQASVEDEPVKPAIEAPEPSTAPVVAPGSAKEPPAGDPAMGDKDPAVIAWWFKHRPKEAVEKYRDRRGSNLQPYIQ